MPEQSIVAPARCGHRLAERVLGGTMVAVMFAGTALAFHLGFTAVEAHRDLACAEEIIHAEIEGLRQTPWPILNDRFLTPAERRVAILPHPSSQARTSTAPENARQFIFTRVILDPAPRTGAPLRVALAVYWADRSGRERVRRCEVALTARPEDLSLGPQLAQLH